jgi:signal transduction histidine kinase
MATGENLQTPISSISDGEIELRKRWLEFGDSDESVIKEEIDKLLGDRLDELMEEMYSHFLSFEETRSFFPNETTLNRAKSAQKEYFRRLTKGNYDRKYVEERINIGLTHYRIELDPKWYLGAYNHVLAFMLPLVLKRFEGKLENLSSALKSLLKLIFFDMGLAIESYIAAKESAIRRHRDSIRELETERRVTKSIMEGAPIGIVNLSVDFTCLECNDEFVEILAHGSRNNVIGKSLFELTPHLERALFEQVFGSGQPCRRTADPLRFLRDGSSDVTYWDWAAWPVKDDSGKITNLVAMFANVTDRVLLQQQREDFVATLTHDLKTPVLATNRMVQYLLDGDLGPISEQQREALDTLRQSNTALYSLVQTLLDVYRFDSGVKELHMKECNLAAIIAQMVTEIMPLAQEKGIELKAILPGDPHHMSLDEDEIRRVLQNLIDNSLKYTPNNGTITVTMTQSGKKTTVSVEDTGRGIPEENKSKLFQRFWQAGSTGRHYASTGLGLYLCSRIIEAHGGRIWCESTFGKGSTFFFELTST